MGPTELIILFVLLLIVAAVVVAIVFIVRAITRSSRRRPAAAPMPPPVYPQMQRSKAEELSHLAALHQQGLLSDDEFTQAKNQLLR